MTEDIRLQQLSQWIEKIYPGAKISVASADASFRRYFRIHHENRSYITMDAPPEKENISPFIDVTERLLQAGVHVPEIHQLSLSQGFLVLSDLGSTPYLEALEPESASQLYTDAFEALFKLQKANSVGLPVYNQQLLSQEMELMPEWFLQQHLGIAISATERKIISTAYDFLSNEILQQPQVFVHRDYHSRNLMVLRKNNPGIIDYQDAVLGPVTYDLVSLLRDCYISWPIKQVENWALQFRNSAVESEIISSVSDETFIRWFDLMGLQRHIKVLGIFARLYHRDGKTAYLNDLPLTLSYVLQVAIKYPELQALVKLFEQSDIPKRIGLIELT